MNSRQVRWIVAMLSGGVVAWFAVRRRQELLSALPSSVQDSIQERIVLPFTAFGDPPPNDPLTEAVPGSMTRKVGRNRRISVHGKLYGPLDGEYIGQQVDVVETDGAIVVSLDGQQLGTFAAEE
ncbi:MAG: hypothetical protein H0X37_25245 [Herpetosiphonaceae bacterium]|nr:hypothetical protein [Herpetosiphonaceae bacterium]